ncbi:MAG: class I SAM-dependent methyltransferase [Acidobacteria bacterium]|nr:class I SAM-dependent methyltransferase [Acidobacteriota bacterium]
MPETCDICNTPDSMSPLLETSLLGITTAWVHQCKSCGFRQIRPRLDRETLSLIYPGDYFHSERDFGYRDFSRQAQRSLRIAYFLSRKMQRPLPPKARLLEIGCALGFLLHALEKYTSWRVQGLDVSPFASYFAGKMYGVPVECGTLEEARFPDRHFDFIIQKDLLEHVTHPREHMMESNRILKSGGYLWLITPNGEANIRPLQHAARKIRDAGMDALPLLGQGHLSFFSRNHLMRLFSETGFDCISMRNISIRRGLRALGYLPRGNRSFSTICRKDISLPAKANKGAVKEDGFEKLYEQIARDIKRRYSPIRSRPFYFHQRRLLQSIGRLPGWATIGLDFECLLRKR